METYVYLIRHGESEGNREGRFRGGEDFPLSEEGKLQVKKLGEALKDSGISLIYTSPLIRAYDTAKAVSETTGAKIIVEPAFRSISLGAWEGKTREEIERLYPEEFKLWLTYPEKLRMPGFEPIPSLRRRATGALNRIVRENPGGKIAVVSHTAVLKVIFAGILGLKPPYFWKVQFATASYSLIKYREDRGYSVVFLNYTHHLRGVGEESPTV